jgi:hypothetical protein
MVAPFTLVKIPEEINCSAGFNSLETRWAAAESRAGQALPPLTGKNGGAHVCHDGYLAHSGNGITIARVEETL